MSCINKESPRRTIADAEQFNQIYLIKLGSSLKATYQIRLLTFRAAEEGKQLVLIVNPHCKFDQDLLDLINLTGKTILREES